MHGYIYQKHYTLKSLNKLEANHGGMYVVWSYRYIMFTFVDQKLKIVTLKYYECRNHNIYNLQV